MVPDVFSNSEGKRSLTTVGETPDRSHPWGVVVLEY